MLRECAAGDEGVVEVGSNAVGSRDHLVDNLLEDASYFFDYERKAIVAITLRCTLVVSSLGSSSLRLGR